jgi:hypothetical protein
MKTKYQGIVKDRMEVSYVYDPLEKKLECDAIYNGAQDSFCVMYDEYLTHETIQEFINGFIQYLQEKQGGRK